jgi:hypothetical protein
MLQLALLLLLLLLPLRIAQESYLVGGALACTTSAGGGRLGNLDGLVGQHLEPALRITGFASSAVDRSAYKVDASRCMELDGGR